MYVLRYTLPDGRDVVYSTSVADDVQLMLDAVRACCVSHTLSYTAVGLV